MPRWVAAAAAVVLAVALLALGLSWSGRARTAYTGVPTPPPFSAVTPLVLHPGQRACQRQVALATDTRAAVVVAWRVRRPGPPLGVEVAGPGYRGSGRVAGGYTGVAALQAPVPAPPRSLLATVCVRDLGRRAVPLEASVEARIVPRSATFVDGVRVGPKMTLLLTEGRDRSIRSRRGEILGRIAAMQPWWIGRVSLAILALALVLGVPTLVVRALWTARD